MSISSEISRISGNVSDALTAISNKGVTVPSGSNSDDLADLISQITGGGTGATTVVTTQDSHGGDIVTITTGIDISNDTVTADKLLYGYTAHNAAGQAITGTYVPSGGVSVTQDANGYLVIGSGSSGGGGIDEPSWATSSQTVTIGANSVTNTQGAATFFSSYSWKILYLITATSTSPNNQLLFALNSGGSCTRLRGGNWNVCAWNNASYDCTLHEGSQYLLIN